VLRPGCSLSSGITAPVRGTTKANPTRGNEPTTPELRVETPDQPTGSARLLNDVGWISPARGERVQLFPTRVGQRPIRGNWAHLKAAGQQAQRTQ
jgi:hypothetical protein